MAQPIWNTTAGSLGIYPATVIIDPPIVLSANSGIIDPLVTYKIISGSLPLGVSMTVTGIISGTPTLVSEISEYIFVIRATNSQGEIRDRSFSFTVSGTAGPKFSLPSGSLFAVVDSVWVERQVAYSNPVAENKVTFSVVQGLLPLGLEMNSDGLIRGYPDIPLEMINFKKVYTTATSTTADTNVITCSSTIDFIYGRPIIFTGLTFGNIAPGKTYYVNEVLNTTDFTISTTQYGPVVYLTTAVGFMNVTLPDTVIGQPTARTYNFDLLLESPIGTDLKSYYVTVINQNLPLSRGGPGNPYLTRQPVILNTRPQDFVISNTDPYYDYYLFPDGSNNTTYPATDPAFIGNFESDNYLSFKVIGYTFDNYQIKYQFVGLPAGLMGDVDTGWVYGTPVLNSDTIGNYSFTVRTYKTTNPNIQSGLFIFSLNIYKNITNTIIWITPSSLGTIANATLSTKHVNATADVELEYRLVSGTLPPNLLLETNGEITGYVANQPADAILEKGMKTEYSFQIQAYSPLYPVVNSTKTFTLTVVQQYDTPMDTLYMKATPSVENRLLINSLLDNNTIIPESYIYRPNDVNFGKARDVIYEHQYGVTASDIEKYLASISNSFYWRNITLGTLETAIARDENNEIIYEVVYSRVIDDLVNSKGQSVSFDIVWPEPIKLNLGPWLTSITDIHASYTTINNQSYYTSLTPGSALVLFPNSLLNMNKQIADTIGQQYDSRILPAWMTSQQLDGNTLGFTRSWVICYTKPRIVVDGVSLTYDEFQATGLEKFTIDQYGNKKVLYKSYAEIVKDNIETMWRNKYGEINKLNQINFTLDRFSVDKSMTYNYDNYFTPPAWTGLPSGTPVPDPKNSRDFYVLFPRKTILPNDTQL